MSAARQGSASFTIVIAGLTALIIGAMVLTFVFYPIVTPMLESPLFGTMTTTSGVRVTTYVRGLWVFWGAIILIGITSFIWVRTRQ